MQISPSTPFCQNFNAEFVFDFNQFVCIDQFDVSKLAEHITSFISAMDAPIFPRHLIVSSDPSKAVLWSSQLRNHLANTLSAKFRNQAIQKRCSFCESTCQYCRRVHRSWSARQDKYPGTSNPLSYHMPYQEWSQAPYSEVCPSSQSESHPAISSVKCQNPSASLISKMFDNQYPQGSSLAWYPYARCYSDDSKPLTLPSTWRCLSPDSHPWGSQSRSQCSLGPLSSCP